MMTSVCGFAMLSFCRGRIIGHNFAATFAFDEEVNLKVGAVLKHSIFRRHVDP